MPEPNSKQLTRSYDRWLFLGCIFAAVSVSLGAIGAHGIEGWLESQFEDHLKRLANWEVASRYMMYHALALVALGTTTGISRRIKMATGVFFIAGIILFCGCLYGYVITSNKTLVMLVPLGGLCFIVGWLCYASGYFFRDQLVD